MTDQTPLEADMRETSFGRMQKVDFGGPLDSDVEVMQFESSGRAHSHARAEVAICVSGEGVVYIDGPGERPTRVRPGDWVWIPPSTSHWMEPKEGEVLSMLIAYQTEGKGGVE